MAKNKIYVVPQSQKQKKQVAAPVKGVRTLIANNKKARHDYTIEDVFEAGLVLGGTEVKALRAGRISLLDAFCSVDYGEAWLEGAHIGEYERGSWTNHAPRRKRKLLLHRSEISRLEQASREKGLTIIPLQVYWLDGRAKVEIALARGKKEYDKRQTLREKQDNREALRAMRQRERM